MNFYSPFLLRCRISLASFSVTPAGATTKSSLFVMALKINSIISTYENIFKLLDMQFLEIINTHLLQKFIVVLLRQEVDISGGDDAHQLAAHFARLRDRNAREAVSHFGLSHIPDRVARTHHNWVRDKALLKPLESERNQANHDYHDDY